MSSVIFSADTESSGGYRHHISTRALSSSFTRVPSKRFISKGTVWLHSQSKDLRSLLTINLKIWFMAVICERREKTFWRILYNKWNASLNTSLEDLDDTQVAGPPKQQDRPERSHWTSASWPTTTQAFAEQACGRYGNTNRLHAHLVMI